MKTQKIVKVFKSTILMIITTLVIIGILQLIIGGIKENINDTKTIASTSKFSGNLAAGETAPGDFNVPSKGEFTSYELNKFGGAPLIKGYEDNAYCISEGTQAPVYKYSIGGFDKSAWESLADKYYAKCTTSEHDDDSENTGFHIKTFPWKKIGTKEVEVPQSHYLRDDGSADTLIRTVLKIEPNSSGEEHTKFEVPEELYTPGYYKVKGSGNLNSAMAYVVSSAGLTSEKQVAIWRLLEKANRKDPCKECPDSSLAKEAERYEKYDKQVREAGGLNPQNTSTMVTPIVDIKRQTYTLGPFSVTYIESGTSFGGGVSFAGITGITVQGYISSGSSIGGGMSIGGSIILADSATGSTGSSNLSYFNPDKSEKVDRNSQVYPRSGQPFYVVISNPNAGATSEDECITSISVKVKFKYMLAEGKQAELEGIQYVAKPTIDENQYEDYGNYHWVPHCCWHTGHYHEIVKRGSMTACTECRKNESKPIRILLLLML